MNRSAQRTEENIFGVTKRNKVKQLKWRGFLRWRLQMLEMAEGFWVRGGGNVEMAEGLEPRNTRNTRKPTEANKGNEGWNGEKFRGTSGTVGVFCKFSHRVTCAS
jgi:hypothetical protein